MSFPRGVFCAFKSRFNLFSVISPRLRALPAGQAGRSALIRACASFALGSPNAARSNQGSIFFFCDLAAVAGVARRSGRPLGACRACASFALGSPNAARSNHTSIKKSLRPEGFLVISPRFERGTHSLEGCCSIQLSYETTPNAL